MADAIWRIPSTGWPATPADPDAVLTTGEIMDVLDQVSLFYPAALASLADTEIPAVS